MKRRKRLVVGLGNPHFGDDAFGAAVLGELRRRGGDPGAELLDAGTDLLASIDSFGDYDEVILVDAVIDPSRAGEIAVIEQEELLGWPDASPTCHAISPLVAIKLFRMLHPEYPTRFTLVALFSDGLRTTPTESPHTP